jgi:two-component system, OmpR family, sensor histidine kinase VicK
MNESLNALIVDDREHDAALLVRALKRGGYELSYERVESEAAMTAALGRQTWDIVLADYSMPQFDVMGALAVVATAGVDIPFIVVSGSVGEETAVEVMRAGAHDLILKHNLKRLIPAVARELEAAKTRRERQAADAKLDCERQLLQQLMQGIPDAICFKDTELRYIRLNDAERSFLNIPAGTEIIGETSDRFIPPDLAARRRLDDLRVLATGEPLIDCVDKTTAADGVTRWIATTKAPTRGSNGEIVGIVEIARDITEKKRQEQLKSEFIATVSHELRTPLTSIVGSIGFLEAGAAPDATARLLKIALDNCRRLVGIVNDILDIEKIEAGKMAFDRKPVEIRALLEQVAQANQGMAEQYGIAIRVDGAPAQNVMFTDPDRLTQTITNLLSNAIKFSPRGEEVIIRAEETHGRACIEIRDYGPGIPQEYRERIFEKFVQVDATDQRQRGGTGLGLSIAKEIVTQLGGRISFEDAPDRGTIFRIELPTSEADVGTNGAADAAPNVLAS